MLWKKIVTTDYFGVLDLLGYLVDRLRGKSHFFGNDIHKNAIDQAMKKYKDDSKKGRGN